MNKLIILDLKYFNDFYLHEGCRSKVIKKLTYTQHMYVGNLLNIKRYNLNQ